MAKKLLIRFAPLTPGVDPALVDWMQIGDDGKPDSIRRGSLDEVGPLSHGSRVIVLVPGIDVLLLSAQVPTQNRQRLLKAMPYLLEEQLASDIEDLHFAPGERTGDGTVPCAVVARTRMDEWLTRLREFHIQPDVLAVDFLALAYEPGVWTLYKDANGVSLRSGLQSGLFVELDNLVPMLEVAFDQAGTQRPARLRILDADVQTAMPDLTALNIEFTHDPFDAQAFLQLAQDIDRTNTINLLQGDYSRREQMGKLWRPWVPVAALAAAFVVLHLTLSAMDYLRYKKQVQELQGEVEKVYLGAFPNEKRVPNAKVQMEQHLKELRGGSKGGGGGFLSVLGGAAGILKSTPGLELRSVRYKDGKLDIDMTVRDLQVLDKLKQTLMQQAAVDVEIVSANARGDVVESRIQLRGHSS